MNALHEQFVAEARELIQQANDDLIAAEREGFSEERIDRVFRVFHTLKGSAAVVDLPAMGLVMHAAEDVLSAIQAGRLGATSLVIDHALACLDQVASWVDEFEAHEALPAGSGEAARKLAEDLRGLIQVQASTQPAAGRMAGRDGDEVPDWVRSLLAAAGHAEARAGIPVHRILLRAGSGLFLRRPRSAGRGPACARAPAVAHGSPRSTASARRPRSVLLQSPAERHMRHDACRACRRVPPAAGPGPDL